MVLKQAVEELQIKQDAQNNARKDAELSKVAVDKEIIAILSEYKNIAQKYADKYDVRMEIRPLGNIIFRLPEINRHTCSITLWNSKVVVCSGNNTPSRAISKSHYNDTKYTEFSESALDQAIRNMIQAEIDESTRCLMGSKLELDKKQLEYDSSVEWLNKIKSRLD